ncbi:MAG: hypothetical protein JWN04_6688 [Myxococcaceae bacterium]|nr:hypothetical protein [Myxococcaceae bacterium]
MHRLAQVRQQLLALHRALLASQRVGYERRHGRLSSGSFLEQVVNAPEFAWLQPLTALIVSLDEALDLGNSATAEDAAQVETAYLADAKKLLVANAEGNDFERHYAAALQDAPEVVLEHGALVRLLAAAA